MEQKNYIGREELYDIINNAKNRVRILGAVAFNLPYEKFREEWKKKIDSGKLQIEIICESEPQLHNQSLVSVDKWVSGYRTYSVEEFLITVEKIKEGTRNYFVGEECNHLEPEVDAIATHLKKLSKTDTTQEKRVKAEIDEGVFDKSPFKQCFSLRTCYWWIKPPVINVDDDYYFGCELTKYINIQKFEKLTEDHFEFDERKKYIYAYFDAEDGAKKYSTEITAKDNRTEVIGFYDKERRTLGLLPRDANLNSTANKVVVWGMVFTRDGKVLIHKRASNAKDNRDMWDKSFGGHVDKDKDVVDTARAAAREMLEELKKVELEGQGGRSVTSEFEVNEDKPIYLGDWRPEVRFAMPFSEIKKKKDDYFFFRVNYKFSKHIVESPRTLPNGDIQTVNCFPDVYAFVAPEGFTTRGLENSEYLILSTDQLFDMVRSKKLERDGKVESVKITPDLNRIVTQELWREFVSFSEYLNMEISN